MSCKLISLGNILNYISYKAYYSPPYGGGAGGGASSYKAYRSPPYGGGAWGWGFKL